MMKLTWNEDGKPEWVEQTEEEFNAEFRANHGGKSALEIMGHAELKALEVWLQWA